MICTHSTGTRLPAVLVCLFFICLYVHAQEQALPTAPSFTVRDIGNKLVNTDSLIADGPLIIDFWATWCAPCMAEFRALKKIVKQHKDKNLRVLAINQDAPSEIAKVKQTVKTRRLPFIVAIDKDKSIGQKYHVNALPTLFLVGTDGKVHLRTRGFVSGDGVKLEKEIRDLLQVE
jgi:cytochrome c biogenesis protein CcmG, thiol:disulfide interchange protein DsbE